MPKTKYLMIVAALLAAFAVLAAARARLASAPSQRDGRAAERVEVETVTVRSTGFDPAEITRTQGHFILEVDNRSGLEALNLRIDAEHGRRLREATVPRTQLDWRHEFDLRPGRYLLTDAERPDWVCRITITAR